MTSVLRVELFFDEEAGTDAEALTLDVNVAPAA